jgi:hypothetical protein
MLPGHGVIPLEPHWRVLFSGQLRQHDQVPGTRLGRQAVETPLPGPLRGGVPR